MSNGETVGDKPRIKLLVVTADEDRGHRAMATLGQERCAMILSGHDDLWPMLDKKGALNGKAFFIDEGHPEGLKLAAICSRGGLPFVLWHRRRENDDFETALAISLGSDHITTADAWESALWSASHRLNNEPD